MLLSIEAVFIKFYLTFFHQFWNGDFSSFFKSSTCDGFQWCVPKEMIGGIDTWRVKQLQIWQIERELADASATVHCLRFMLKTSLLLCTVCNSVLFGVQMTCLCSNMQPSDKAQVFFGIKCRKLLFTVSLVQTTLLFSFSSRIGLLFSSLISQ